ncbi:aspartic acid-rich protein [Lucilia cuprina]|uniref:aspartic acid-rich protein n=1 Tax=Lucilia cuprina TaxID=7375 RepID=UPI001F06ED4B|nr:aspartic acid-rich protein [Lucilia cuprina]
MNSPFGEVFMFLTNLAWKSRLTIPVLVTTAFLIMDIRLQIEINIQSGQVAAAEFNRLDNDGDDEYIDNNDDDDDEYNYDEYTTDSSADVDDEDDGENDNSW